MKGICIMSEIKKDNEWQSKYKKEHHDKQQAQLETSLVKAIGINSPEMRAMKTMIVEDGFRKIQEMQKELARVKQENNDSFNRIAELCEVNERHQEINGKLQVRLTELEEENKKMHEHLNKQVDNARKSGM